MKKLKIYILFISGLLLLQVCNDSGLIEKDPSALYGKKYTFSVNRIANSPDALFPKDKLTEAAYIPYPEQKSYSLSFSQDGSQIIIEPGLLKGIKTSSQNSITYNLNEGMLAGGRVVIWSVSNEIQAELTLYGSGKPILLSERGKLLQD